MDAIKLLRLRLNCVGCRENVAVADHVGQCLPVDGTQGRRVLYRVSSVGFGKEGEAEPAAAGERIDESYRSCCIAVNGDTDGNRSAERTCIICSMGRHQIKD